MKCKKASLVINPRGGQNLVHITDILAVLAAAGWDTDLALKEYGGQVMELAEKAARDGSDLIVGYGGDGTLSQVINGVMNTKKRRSVVGLIPGGTANVWATEIGVPSEPVKAALALIDSKPRKVDIGHIEVEALCLPAGIGEDEASRQIRQKKGRAGADARQHFLLMAGLGMDAAVMEQVSKPLKYRVGALAVGVSTAKALPGKHAFPVELRLGGTSAGDADVVWKGEALQVVIGNTRLYAKVVEMTPDAYIDDGILDICIITAGNPLTTMQQITSLLLRHQPDNVSAEYFRGAEFSLSVPASVGLQLDGSTIKLKDYLSKPVRKKLGSLDESEQVMVTYRFNAQPQALSLAVPFDYDDVLFRSSHSADHAEGEEAQNSHDHAGDESAQNSHTPEAEAEKETPPVDEQATAEEQQKDVAYIKALMENGRKVTVTAVRSNPAKKNTYVVAGTITRQATGESRPVALSVDEHVVVTKQDGEHVVPSTVRDLQVGATIVVEGKKSKRGVISAKQIVI